MDNMTESEAIKILQRDLQIQLENKALPDGIEAIQIAIQALEKQLPKKRDNYSCPICSHYFEDGECFTYCPECGQRLER